MEKYVVQVFDELLLDADWSTNAGSWMWLSCSSFFEQFFHTYCPVNFGKRTDPNGDYIRSCAARLRIQALDGGGGGKTPPFRNQIHGTVVPLWHLEHASKTRHYFGVTQLPLSPSSTTGVFFRCWQEVRAYTEGIPRTVHIRAVDGAAARAEGIEVHHWQGLPGPDGESRRSESGQHGAYDADLSKHVAETT